MAKLYKVSFFFVDVNGTYGDGESVTDVLQSRLDGQVAIASTEESEEFEWHDGIDLNYTEAPLEQYEAYLTRK